MHIYPVTRRARRRSHLPTLPVPDWSRLARNDAVRVLHKDGRVTSGRIDMIAADRSVFWIIQDAGRGRVMICSADKPSVIKTAPTEENRL